MNEIPYIDSHPAFLEIWIPCDSWLTMKCRLYKKIFLSRLTWSFVKTEMGSQVQWWCNQINQKKENVFHLHNAEQAEFIKGIVGWVDLQANSVEERLVFIQVFKDERLSACVARRKR